MELTFYNSTGRPVAYTDDGENIYLFSGEPVAYLADGAVYSFSGTYLGWFDNGWIWDKNGKPVFFSERSSGGPSRPVRMMRPARAARQVRSTKGARQARPARPGRSALWSDLSGEQFFRS